MASFTYAPVDVEHDARYAVCEDCDARYEGRAPDGWALGHTRGYGHRVAVMRSYKIAPRQEAA